MATNYWTEQYDFVLEHSSGKYFFDMQGGDLFDQYGNDLDINELPFEIKDALRKKIEEIEKEL
jgi:hypothetical protein